MKIVSTIFKNTILFIVLIIPGSVLAETGITLLTEEAPPLNYLDENQKPAGFAVELVQEMAKRVGDPAKIEIVPWARGYKDACERPNTALFSTVWSVKRDALFKWVGPLFTMEFLLYKKRGSKLSISSIDDAKKVERIGTYKDVSSEQLLTMMGFNNLDSSLEDIANPKKLMAERIDLWASTAMATSIAKLAGVDPAGIEPTVTLEKNLIYLAFSKKTDSSVVAKWQQAFDSMVEDRTVEIIMSKYGLAKKEARLQIYTEDSPPLNFRKNGQITGLSTEIVRQMFRRIGHLSTIHLVSWARGYKEVLDKSNVALYSTSRNEQREELFQWVGPIIRIKDVLFAKKGSGIKITSLDDAKKVNAIGTYKDDSREQFLLEHGFSNLDSVLNNRMNPKKLVNGRIDLWISSVDEGMLLAQNEGIDPGELEVVYTVTESELYMAVSKQTDPSIVNKLQEALDAMRMDGSFAEIVHTWSRQH